ncbi:hypothetical protein P873_13570 [Arenimonas composti TR7-09 = DSM 18010]|uniref:EAL domain-containing protein n=2 Tax=Arenimonas TaxID=490567 RepID=A0A091BAS5_9GAMM|nr:hypothetical protein P873_13570 [Arenimonas composti TR7-09 = DSM 18010]
MIGMESLVRWRHPQDGLVMPGQFIPMAEEAGVISELSRAVLANALRDLGRWRAEGRQWDVAVNVSTKDFSDLRFPDHLAEEAARAGAPLQHLILEITESQMAADRTLQLDILTRLRLKRVRLSIDDFGTGYSFLSQLREFPVDELKIDRSFVHGAARDTQLAAIVQSNIRLASELGLRVVAEGVEDLDDWRFLRAAGCTYAQGYFVARPMPGAELVAWEADWRSRRSELAA